MVTKKRNFDKTDLWETIIKTVSPIKSDKISPANILNKPAKNSDSKLISKEVKQASLFNDKKSQKNQNKMAKTKIPNDLRYEKPSGMDGSSTKKLKAGKFNIEATLDLHGMTQQRAYSTLQSFILSSVLNQFRTILVITGKGADGRGVLKTQFPSWIKTEACAPYILAFGQAQAKDGGSGAFYIRLRRNRRINK